MFYLKALSVDDLMKAVSADPDTRSRGCAPNLTNFYSDKGVADFITRCSGSKNSWNQRIRFQDWNLLPDEAQEEKNWEKFKQDYPEVLDLDVKVGCNCPAFQYLGSAYIVDSLDAGESSMPRYDGATAPEGRPPNVRDPGLDNTLCKHLIAVLRRFF